MKMRTAILLTAITLLALGGCQETPEPDPVTAPAAPAEPEPAPTEPEEPDTDSDESTEPSGDTNQ